MNITIFNKSVNANQENENKEVDKEANKDCGVDIYRRKTLSLIAILPFIIWTESTAQGIFGKNKSTATTIKFSEMYGKIGVRGIEYSTKLKSLAGQKVSMRGYMAPPLKPKLDFFVLTREPMSTCPFCSSAADWPADIVLVIMPSGKEIEPTIKGVTVTGKLDIGVKRDEETGFVSLVRIYADTVKEG